MFTMLTYHAQIGLEFDLKPLEGALQVPDLCARRRQVLCVRNHFLLHHCKLDTTWHVLMKNIK